MAFKGDMRATAVKQLGQEIDAVLTVARPGNRRGRCSGSKARAAR